MLNALAVQLVIAKNYLLGDIDNSGFGSHERVSLEQLFEITDPVVIDNVIIIRVFHEFLYLPYKVRVNV